MFEYLRCLDELRPRAFVWENVSGCLSTKDNAFGQFLETLEELGYKDVAWRVLDAQFFGVAQRRQRVFLVGHLGEGLRSCAVLFEPESLRGDSSSVRAKREELARAAAKGSGEDCAYAFKVRGGNATYTKPNGKVGTAGKGALVSDDVAFTLATTQDQTIAFASHGVAACMSSGQANAEITTDDISPTLTCLHEQPIVLDRAAFNQGVNATYPPHVERTEVMDPIVAKGPHAVAYEDESQCKTASDMAVTIDDGTSWVVRRLTPTECERLQGFPDGWTDVGRWTTSAGRNLGSSDSARYKALGNSMCVNVMRWIGRRLMLVWRMEDDGEICVDGELEDEMRYAYDVGFDEGYQCGYEDGVLEASSQKEEGSE